MKILIDVVYTGLISTCSTSYLAWEIIRELSKKREDVFFYLLYPESMKEMPKEMEFLEQMPERVTHIPITTNHLDRVAELFSLPPEMKEILSPVGHYWDFDFIVSSRIPQLPMYRVLGGREVGFSDGSLRGFYGLEEMPVLSFRKTVPWGKYMELQTLTSYLQCDGVLINNLWTAKPLSVVGRKHLSAYNQRALIENLHEVVPVTLERLDTKRALYKDGEDFYVAFVGRVTGTRSFDKVADTFRKQFSYPIGKNKKHMKFVISTNSRSFGASKDEEIEFVDVQFNGREEFHSMLDTKAHVVLNLSDVEDFSLSTYETLIRGVPMIVMDRPWNDFLGPEYPFRVDSIVEVYALITEFAKDYKKQYAKFANWEDTWWKGLVEGPKNKTTSDVLWGLVVKFEEDRIAYFVERGIGGSYLDLANELDALGMEEINIIEEMTKRGILAHKERAMLMRSPMPLTLKILLNIKGYKDTNKPGVVKKCN